MEPFHSAPSLGRANLSTPLAAISSSKIPKLNSRKFFLPRGSKEIPTSLPITVLSITNTYSLLLLRRQAHLPRQSSLFRSILPYSVMRKGLRIKSITFSIWSSTSQYSHLLFLRKGVYLGSSHVSSKLQTLL